MRILVVRESGDRSGDAPGTAKSLQVFFECRILGVGPRRIEISKKQNASSRNESSSHKSPRHFA